MNETKPMMNQQDDERARNAEESFIDIVFDGPPSHESGRFVEVEQNGKSIKFGEWVHREDAYWALRIPSIAAALQQARREGMEALDGEPYTDREKHLKRISELEQQRDALKAALEKCIALLIG